MDDFAAESGSERSRLDAILGEDKKILNSIAGLVLCTFVFRVLCKHGQTSTGGDSLVRDIDIGYNWSLFFEDANSHEVTVTSDRYISIVTEFFFSIVTSSKYSHRWNLVSTRRGDITYGSEFDGDFTNRVWT
ncbi:hypothetical protein ANN_14072 [Periplaneta americana]|uniref:Uncharacterized protein n=1 Tax=Periplaneta americana TaxID=6978 RepID=A0ABQ8SVA3_PERAM|nr:hypothetical protein ANN_14072 [Periplaneta americana]